ncbi:MAG: ribonuclease H-like domain-containing protein [Methanobacteriaceae archaeon]|nr:ribonuclease H-like domain-containing protein [Methanobacteriaceae archaeon]
MPFRHENDPQKLKQKLLEEYQDKSLEDLENGREIETNWGSCYCFTTEEELEIQTLDQKKVKECVMSDLKLIKGIGEKKEIKLKEEGYSSLEDLKEHEIYGKAACELTENVECENIDSILELISSRYPSSHPLNLLLSSLSGLENMLFMDIETLGLKEVPLILIGVAETSRDGLIINQYLLRDLKEEKAVLDGFLSHQDDRKIYVTFNGRSFDVPFIRSRIRYHGLNNTINSQHLDLLHYSRRQWRNQLPNCRLQTLEKHLFGVERCDDVPSSQVPEFYLTYRETGNIGPLIPIIEHNREDVITLARILSLLHQSSDF